MTEDVERRASKGGGRPGLRSIAPQVWILSACQVLYFAALSVDLTLTALVGLAMAPTPALATLPLALITLVGTVAAALAGLLVGRLGYTRVLVLGALCAAAGGAASAWAVYIDSFPLLCAGTATVGLYRATGGYIRFMAADCSSAETRSRAISIVLLGGLLAAFVGPLLATGASGLFGTEYVGAYVVVAALALLNLPLLLLPVMRVSGRRALGGDKKPLAPIRISDVRTSPPFVYGLMCLGIAGLTMTLTMAMAPIASSHAGHTETAGAMIIQWHMVGMFAPSLFSGLLVERFGRHRMAMAGAITLSVAAAIALTGESVPAFVVALALNGLAWNILFTCGTAFVVDSYPTGRGSRVQAFVEGVGSGLAVLGSFVASAMYLWAGWMGSNVPVLAIGVLFLVFLALPQVRAKNRNAVPEVLAAPGAGDAPPLDARPVLPQKASS